MLEHCPSAKPKSYRQSINVLVLQPVSKTEIGLKAGRNFGTETVLWLLIYNSLWRHRLGVTRLQLIGNAFPLPFNYSINVSSQLSFSILTVNLSYHASPKLARTHFKKSFCIALCALNLPKGWNLLRLKEIMCKLTSLI